ncbi:DUF2625 family protein [Dactylosporangium sp. CA-152071]|uniref:DUF2625 family protein n=1 Tax=Dactylosporangium sp. CA-152071 TaxID=3239933 RepID=UPI003D8F985C
MIQGNISQLVAAAPYPVEVLPVNPERASVCLTALGITARSWLGAVVADSGGLVDRPRLAPGTRGRP